MCTIPRSLEASLPVRNIQVRHLSCEAQVRRRLFPNLISLTRKSSRPGYLGDLEGKTKRRAVKIRIMRQSTGTFGDIPSAYKRKDVV